MSSRESIDSSRIQELNDEISHALEKKKFWLAREHYRSLTRVCGFDQKVYQDFAMLLLRMKEDLAAGKFFFLSGDRSDEAKRCINHFLQRYKRRNFTSIRSNFPRAAQKMKIDEFPEPIKSELKEWNFRDEQTKEIEKKTPWDRLIFFGAISVFVLFIVSIPVGIWTIVNFILSLFSR